MNTHNFHSEIPVSGTIAVILNWKDPENTKQCIDCLLGIPQITGIVVVHNESSESSLKSHSPDNQRTTIFDIYVPENRGFSGGVNVGIKFALKFNPQSVLMINNDATILQGDFELLNSQISKQQVMVAPKIVNPNGSAQASGAKLSNKTLATDEFSIKDPDYLTFACVVIHPYAFTKIGFLDEVFFMYWEDVDFGLRVKAAGLDLVVVPEATVVHAVSSSRKIAGSRVDLYSAFGLGAFGQLHSDYKAACYFRILLRVSKRIALFQFSFAYKLWRAYVDGKKMERPSYLKVTKENWPL